MAMKMRMRSILTAGAVLFTLVGCMQADRQASFDPSAPGATGRTVVPGSTSTIAGDALATEQQQKWGGGRQR